MSDNPCNRGSDGNPCNRIRRHASGCIFKYDKEQGDCPLCYIHAHDPEILRGAGRPVKHTPCPESYSRRVPLSVARPPCKWEGDIVEHCTSCPANSEARHTRWCDHPNATLLNRETCTRAHPASTLQRCDQCDDHERPGGPVPYPGTSLTDALALIRFGDQSKWPREWQTWPGMKKAYWKLADEFLATPHPPPSNLSGRGIVIAAGGPYLPGAYVTVRSLRHHGCVLPIEIWYMGERERNRRYEALLAPYGVRWVDADQAPGRSERGDWGGYQLKSFAVMNSPFEEVLFLDGDCHPLRDPTYLFDLPEYQNTGAIYFPDLGPTHGAKVNTEPWTKWEHWGVSRWGPKCGIESGQFVFHKRRHWDILSLIRYYDSKSSFYYKYGGHGDKECHRVAWAKFRRPYTLFTEVATWQNPAFLHYAPDEHGAMVPYFGHRVRSKFQLLRTGFATTLQNGWNLRVGFAGEELQFQLLDELRRALV